MTFKNISSIGIILLIIPFVVMISLIIREEYNRRTIPQYRLEITGYDPRDLLTGHYLRFQYKVPDTAPPSCQQNQECYICFDEKGSTSWSEHLPIQTCAAVLDLGKAPTTYNISEIRAPVLDKMMRDRVEKFEAGLIVFSNHNSRITNLYINGQTLAEYFK